MMVMKEAGVNGDDVDWSNLYDLDEPRSRAVSPPNYSGSFPAKDEDGKSDFKLPENRDGPKLLPFEFVALEACLEAACSCLDNEVKKIHYRIDFLMFLCCYVNIRIVYSLMYNPLLFVLFFFYQARQGHWSKKRIRR